MGTRADLYVGRGPNAEWLGSIAWDGYPAGIPSELFAVQDEGAYRRLVAQFLADRADGTTPEMGWPWPWEDSRTTDYAYAFDVLADEGGEDHPLTGKVWASSFGHEWFDPTKPEPGEEEVEGDVPLDADGHFDHEAWTVSKVAVFPNMKDRQAVTRGSRSGTMWIGPTGVVPAKEIDAIEAWKGTD